MVLVINVDAVNMKLCENKENILVDFSGTDLNIDKIEHF